MTRGRAALVAWTLVPALVIGWGCYSFSGGSVPAHLKTIAIPLFDDQSGFGEPGLREQFTTELTNLFIKDNSLEVTNRTNADAILEGTLLPITDAPAVVQQGEQVSRRRITMSVRCTFQDMKLRKKVWEKTFTNWGEYDSGGGLSRRSEGLAEAVKKLTEDILQETVSGW